MSEGKKLKTFFLTKNARQDLEYWRVHQPKKLIKIAQLIESAMADPESGIGKPERLKYQDEITYSRRIDLQNRMVYTISNQCLNIIQLRQHY